MTSAPEVIDRNSADDGRRAVHRFGRSLDETVDDQCEGSKDEGCWQEGIEWGAGLVRSCGSCATKTKYRGEGQGHEQREYEPAIDEKLFEGSAQNE